LIRENGRKIREERNGTVAFEKMMEKARNRN